MVNNMPSCCGGLNLSTPQLINSGWPEATGDFVVEPAELACHAPDDGIVFCMWC